MLAQTRSNTAYAYTDDVTGTRAYATNALNQYDRAGSRNLGWDKRGNVSADVSWRFGHDALDRLRTVTGLNTDETLFYDAEDRLSRSTLNGTTINDLLDGDDLLAEYDAGFMLQRRFLPGPGMDEPLVQYEGAGLTDKSWFASDQLGSIIALSDTGGKVVSRYAYGRFGEPQTLLGTDPLPAFAYTGQRSLPGEQRRDGRRVLTVCQQF